MVTAHCFERTSSLGTMINQMALDVPADVYCAICDDMLVHTEGWDEKIREAWEAKPDGLWWWKNPPNSQTATWAIVSEKWRAAAGQIFTEYFPFWWDDIWLMQLWMLASEGPFLHVDAVCEDRPMRTSRMRDLRFWTDFFVGQLPARKAEAARIREALGWGPHTLTPEAIDLFANRVCRMSPEFLESIEKIEWTQGEVKTPPTPEYLRAYERAKAIMNHKEAA
jgi:hypothetical protein